MPVWWYRGGAEGWPNTTSGPGLLDGGFGSCDAEADYCFGRLPGDFKVDNTDLRAVDGTGAEYLWSPNTLEPVADQPPLFTALFNAFSQGTQASVRLQTWRHSRLSV